MLITMENNNIEFTSLKAIQNLQNERLTKLLNYLNKNSKFYNTLFTKNRINLSTINSIDDIKIIPTTTKNDIQANNWDFLCVPQNKVTEYTSTSGTSGNPITIAQTKLDIERLAYNEFLSFMCIGANKNDVFQLALTLDKQFMAGMAYYLGAVKLGASVVRTGPGAPSMQWETITRLNTSTLVVVPSFILKLIEFAEENNINLKNTPVKRAICIGENIRNERFELNTIGQKVKDKWDIELYSTYASSEMQTAFTECKYGIGGHLHHELLIAEILDDNQMPMKDGEFGELTITTLGVTGLPLLRYRTGDICCMFSEPCLCGRNTPRISPIIGRKQQMIKLKGTSLYPPAIFEILNNQKDIKEYLVEVNTNELGTDEITIYIAAMCDTEKLTSTLTSYLHGSLRVRPNLIFTDLLTVQKMQQQGLGRKALNFIDKR